MERINNALLTLKKINDEYSISNEVVDNLIEDVEAAKVCTPIIGKFSTGKSALVNTLLGYSRKILKEDITPETAVPVEITYNENEDCAGILFNDGSYRSVEIQEYRRLEVDANTVHCTKLSLMNRFLGEIQDVMLVDMPGFESGYEVHNRAIDGYLPKSLAYIITFAADDMIVRTSVGNILKELCLHDMPICIAITKYDKCNSDFERGLAGLKESLKRFVGDKELTYCVTSSFTGEIEELKDFLRDIQEQSQEILFNKYRLNILSVAETTENYLVTTLKSSEMSESELNEQEEQLGKKIDSLNSQFNKEKEEFDSIVVDTVEEIKADLDSSLRAEEDTFVAMIMNKQNIGERINLIIRNAVTKSVQKRFNSKVEKYIKRINDCVAGSSIDNANISLYMNVDEVNKGILSSVVSGAGAAATLFLAGPVIGGILVGISWLINKFRESSRREELKNQIRMKLNSEVFPKVIDDVGNRIEMELSKQMELVNKSIEENIVSQREILEKAMHDVRNKISDEKRDKENLALSIEESLQLIKNLRNNLMNG